jgi:hypothetical protein
MAKKSNLRVIDKGTRYDVSGNLRSLTREIESGKISPRDVIVLTREAVANNVSCRIGMRHFGTGSTEELHWMLSTALNRIEPA